ncbi:MAG: iron-containing redox enzyme family protein [Actinomycetota bacterium]|nr:iron-containing redox enzyme family protein [Actinomycetota bacterium]
MVDVARVQLALQQAGTGFQLLDHPFYQRWQRGELTVGDLADYAVQYRHFEQLLPGFLGQIAVGVTDERAAGLVAMNLADEAGHLALFDRFAAALGATPGPADDATDQLVATYRALAASSPAHGLAGLAAYEGQAAAVAATKARGLRDHYGLDGEAVAFWDVHAELETGHAAWAAEAMASLETHPDTVFVSARRAAEAWWSFLDRREASITI